MWGKNANFIGPEAFGRAEMKPRAINAPGTFYEYNDVRINRFALSLLRLFKKPIPDVFRDEVMNPIGASTTWKWVPYTNAYLDVDGKRMASVSGGTRWGGGMWISTFDMARFGLLWLRGGKWGDKQIVSPAYVKMATAPSAHGPDYGFLWWLNTKGKQYPGSPTTTFEARGQGGNVIHVDREHDLLVVCVGARSRPKASSACSARLPTEGHYQSARIAYQRPAPISNPPATSEVTVVATMG
jgi:CubicO group peptidase (beta-lactamase class C family)